MTTTFQRGVENSQSVTSEGYAFIEGYSRKQRVISFNKVALNIYKKGQLRHSFHFKEVKQVYVALYSSDLLLIGSNFKVIISIFEKRRQLLNSIANASIQTTFQYVKETLLDNRLKNINECNNEKFKAQSLDMNILRKEMNSKLGLKEKRNIMKDFKLKSIILKNQFWVLYCVEDKAHENTKCCLKIYEKQTLQHHEGLKQFIASERINAEFLLTPYIPQLLRSFQTKNKFVFIYKNFNGILLEDYVSTEEIKINKLRRLLSQIVVAIGQVHQSNYVYIDMSPKSFLLDQKGHLTLINLGIANEVNKQYCKPPIDFCAPECFAQDQKAQFSMDWWGLGMLLYRILFKYDYFTKNNILRDEEKKNHIIKRQQFEYNAKQILSKQDITEVFYLMTSLLKKNPEERLGSKNDYHQVLHHKFFEGIRIKELMLRTGTEIIKTPLIVPQNQKERLTLDEDFLLTKQQKPMIPDFAYSWELEDQDSF